MLDPVAFETARENLHSFVIRKAKRVAQEVGFTFIATDNLPNDYEILKWAYNESRETKQPLPIYSGASQNTIYLSELGNYSFRFWHDLVHCQNNLDFTLESEVTVALIQAEDVEVRYGKDSLEYKMFLGDTVGQSLYNSIHQAFPDNQLNFVKALLNQY